MITRRSAGRRSGILGFTLIELLVVVSIIMILMGLLLPALNGARDKAKMVICTAYQKQIGLAIRSYTLDNDGKFPPRYTGPIWKDYIVNGKYITTNRHIPYPVETPMVMDCDNYRVVRVGDWQQWFWPVPRHSRRVNLVWVDGHANNISWTEMVANPNYGQVFQGCPN